LPAPPEHFIKVYGGNSGNTVNAVGVTIAGDGVVIYGGTRAGNLTDGADTDTFVFTAPALTASR